MDAFVVASRILVHLIARRAECGGVPHTTKRVYIAAIIGYFKVFLTPFQREGDVRLFLRAADLVAVLIAFIETTHAQEAAPRGRKPGPWDPREAQPPRAPCVGNLVLPEREKRTRMQVLKSAAQRLVYTISLLLRTESRMHSMPNFVAGHEVVAAHLQVWHDAVVALIEHHLPDTVQADRTHAHQTAVLNASIMLTERLVAAGGLRRRDFPRPGDT